MKYVAPILSVVFVFGAGAFPLAAQPSKSVVFDVDGAKRFPISPYIYGTNMPDWEGRGKRLTLVRWGGNRTTCYNWENNASNAGADWRHQNDAYLDRFDVPGNPIRKLINKAHAADAAVIVTVPMIGYVAADKRGDGDVGQTPNYLQTRFRVSVPRKNAGFDSMADPRDERVYQDEFVHWVERNFPDGRRGGSKAIFYALDNEPDLWSATHARVHPQKVRYDELLRLTLDYAAAIKEQAPQSLVFGPASYGWHGYTTLQDAPDRNNRDFLDFYLQQLRAAEQQQKRRLVDVLDLHWYPEARGGGVRVCEDDAKPETAAARIQAPRSLWDPTYTEQSWITQHSTKGPIRLLPRLREKIAQHYPGTRIALTEYYYGGGADISGALAQADVLGIFGREGVFAAALWHLGKSDHHMIYAAFDMYRNYDGQGGAFGPIGLAAQSSDPARASIYASQNQQGQVVLVAINKVTEDLTVRINLRHCPAAAKAQVYRLTAADVKPLAIGRIDVARFGQIETRLPAYSVSTLVVGAAGKP